MHAQALKRTPLNQVIGLALVLGLAASLTLNVVMLNRSSEDAGSLTAPQSDISLLEKQQRYVDAKEARIEAMDAALGAQALPSTVLTPSQQRYVDLKSDQLDGIQSQVAAKPATAPNFRKLEINSLPGDDHADIAPYSDRLGGKH